jgi:hypothetical protein
MTNPARTRSLRLARRVQARPKTSASSASGYSQPISGAYWLPSSLVQPVPKPPPAAPVSDGAPFDVFPRP